MNKFLLIAFFTTSILHCNAQDTLNNFKIKIGLKYISESSSFHVLTDSASYHVNSLGVPLIIQLGHSKSSFETGLYLINKKEEYPMNSPGFYYGSRENTLITFHNIRIPVNYRLDTRLIYFSAGFYIDNLVSYSSTPKDTADLIDITSFGSRLKIGFNLNIGVEKDFNKHFSVFVEARFASDIPGSYIRPGFGYEYGDPIQNLGFGMGINYKLSHKAK